MIAPNLGGAQTGRPDDASTEGAAATGGTQARDARVPVLELRQVVRFFGASRAPKSVAHSIDAGAVRRGRKVADKTIAPANPDDVTNPVSGAIHVG